MKMKNTATRNSLGAETREDFYLLYQAFCHSTDAIVITDTDGVIREVNQAFSNIFGYAREEAIGRTTSILRSSKTTNSLYKKMWQALEKKGAWQGEIVNRCKDGKEIPVLLSITSVFEEGRCIGYMGVQIDITERKRNERRRTKERKFTESLIETANSLMVTLDLKGCVNLFNAECERVTGYAKKEIIGKNWFDIFIPERLLPDVSTVFERLKKGDLPSAFESPIVTKTGEERAISWKNTIIFDEDDAIIGALAIGHDITERKRVELELAKNEAKVTAIVETAVDGIVTIDDRGVIESFNRTAEELFGFGAEEVIGQNVNILMPSPDREAHDSYIQKYLSTGEKKIIGIGREVEGLRKNGEKIPIQLAVSEFRVEGKRLFAAIVRDLTEQKTLQNLALQSERLATIGRMAAKVAHEVRNPLSAISLNAELLADEIFTQGAIDKAESRALLTAISDEVERLTKLTDEYLQFSRLPNPGHTVSSITHVIEKVLELFETEANARGVQIVRQFPPRHSSVNIDPEQIGRVFLNLFRNSLEAMPNGGILKIRVTNANEHVETLITDTGAGVPEDKRSQIFEPFYTSKDLGTGLGLAISKQIIDEHGGEIACVANTYRGAAFQIRLPAADHNSKRKSR